VQDAAQAFLLAVEAPISKEKVFNVGSDDQNFTVGDIAERVAERIPSTHIDYAPNGHDLRSYRVAFDRIRSVLGFEAERTVDDAINEVGRLMSSGVVGDFRHDQFHNAKWLSVNGRLQGAA
jgi:nucleoside-diphosphate-sugar epimerase